MVTQFKAGLRFKKIVIIQKEQGAWVYTILLSASVFRTAESRPPPPSWETPQVGLL